MRLAYPIVALAMLALAAPLVAQDEPEPAGDAAAADQEAAESSEADEGASGSLGASEARQAEDEDVFIPTEEVPPDDEVVFPVNI
jgi:hypothetical protein